MTDQEWQAGIEQALTAAWRDCWDDEAPARANLKVFGRDRDAIKSVAEELSKALGLRVSVIYTRVDQIGKSRVGPARDEAA